MPLVRASSAPEKLSFRQSRTLSFHEDFDADSSGTPKSEGALIQAFEVEGPVLPDSIRNRSYSVDTSVASSGNVDPIFGLPWSIAAMLVLNWALLFGVCSFLQQLAIFDHVQEVQQEAQSTYDVGFTHAAAGFVMNEALDLRVRTENVYKVDVINAQIKHSYVPTLIAALDPVLSRRFLRRLHVPIVPAVFEATAEEFVDNQTLFESLMDQAIDEDGGLRVAGLAVRQSQAERKIPPFSDGAQNFPAFVQGKVLIHARSWESLWTIGRLFLLVKWQVTDPTDIADVGIQPLNDAPRGVVVEELYALPADAPRLPSFQCPGSDCRPPCLQVQTLFGRVYLLEIRDAENKVIYWALRNGTTSFTRHPPVEDDDSAEESAFLEQLVSSSMQQVVFHSERVTAALGAPLLSLWWLIGAEMGPRLHILRYFWFNDFSLDASTGEAFTDHIIGGLAQGFDFRNREASRSRIFRLTSDDCLSVIGCTNPPTSPHSSRRRRTRGPREEDAGSRYVWCGPQPEHELDSALDARLPRLEELNANIEVL